MSLGDRVSTLLHSKNGVWYWLAFTLVLANLLLFAVGLMRGGQVFGPSDVLPLNQGLRSDWIAVERPWLLEGQSLAQASEPTPVAPSIELGKGRAQLREAIAEAQQKVAGEVSPELMCYEWGPLLPDQKTRVSNALKAWPGRKQEVEQRASLGYIVVIPKEQVQKGQTIAVLAQKGLKDLFPINTPGPLQGSVSAGIFRSEERALAQLDFLKERGVVGAQVRERPGPVRVFFKLEGTAEQVKTLQTLYKTNTRGELNPCSQGASGADQNP